MGTRSGTALVLFSGGQDSTTCLAWALDRFTSVETLGFDYGQRHAIELEARPRILARMRELFPEWSARLASDHLLSLDILKAIGGSALTGAMTIEMGANGLPTSFVPGRNLMFLTAAAALAYRRGARHLVGGMCETDYSGYPDCRDDTIKALRRALDLGMDTHFTVHTPLMKLDKSATWALAERLGGRELVDLIVEETVTCYEGDHVHRQAWGYGCAACPACLLRAKGFEQYATR
jgi:7-cyano-7-deazaguanine synthase